MLSCVLKFHEWFDCEVAYAIHLRMTDTINSYVVNKCSILSLMKVNYALNHHCYETSLFPQAVLNYVMSIDFIVKSLYN